MQTDIGVNGIAELRMEDTPREMAKICICIDDDESEDIIEVGDDEGTDFDGEV